MIIEAYQKRAVISYYQFELVSRIYLTVQYPSERTIGGQWAFQSGEARVSGALSGVFKADPTSNWVNADDAEFITERELERAYPYLVVSLPLSPAHQDQEIELETTLEMAVPTADGTGETRQLNRTVNLFLAGDSYYLRESDYQNWKRSRRVIETPLWLFLVLGSMGASVFLVRRGALEKGGSGDFVMVIRKPSGLKQLGVEAHPLNKVSERQGVEKGAVLGFVNPQSPAGRGGLRAGDIVVQVGDQAVNSPKDLKRIMGKFKKGDVAIVVVMRHHERTRIDVKF